MMAPPPDDNIPSEGNILLDTNSPLDTNVLPNDNIPPDWQHQVIRPRQMAKSSWIVFSLD
jgi:hypothetical protein